MKNILISGGAGFIGSKLSLKLLEKGYNVTVLDSLSTQIHGDNPENSPLFLLIKNKVNFIKGDVRSRDDWQCALENQDAVIHLAAETGTGQSMYEIEKYIDVNISGTAILLDIITNQKLPIKKMIVASSRAIYGEGRHECKKCGIVYPDARTDQDLSGGDFDVKCPFCGAATRNLSTTENSLIHPSSIYGITKQNQEQMVMLIGKSTGIPAVAFRYQNVYGPGQSLTNPYTGILSIFSNRLLSNKSINIFEDGTESRDFVYIEDIVKATVLGLEKKEADFNVFNVGTGIPTDVMTVASTLKKIYNSSSDISISGNYRLGDIRHNYADLSLIKSKLNFEADFTFDKGIKLFAEWVKSQQLVKDDYEKSLEEMKAKGLFK